MNKFINKLKQKLTLYNISIILIIIFVLSIAIFGIYITYGVSILLILLYKLIRRRDIIMKKINLNNKKINFKNKINEKKPKEKIVKKKTKIKTLLKKFS
jgi:hypothetical protein